MPECSTCKWTGCLLSMAEIRAGECDKLYQRADDQELLKRLKDKYHWPNKAYLKKELGSKYNDI